jgi:hypothetical protein
MRRGRNISYWVGVLLRRYVISAEVGSVVQPEGRVGSGAGVGQFTQSPAGSGIGHHGWAGGRAGVQIIEATDRSGRGLGLDYCIRCGAPCTRQYSVILPDILFGPCDLPAAIAA